MVGAGATVSSLGALALTRVLREKRPLFAHAAVVERDGFTVPHSKKAFLEKLAHDGEAVIRASELASKRGVHARVRELGAYLLGEHEKSAYEIKLLAQRLGIDLGTPVPLTATDAAVVASQKADSAKLELLPGLAFDHAFATVMLGAHDHSIGTLKLGADVHSDSEVGALCKSSLAAMMVHRQKLIELCEALTPALEVPSMGDDRPPVVPS